MKKIILTALTIGFCGLTVFAQTNVVSSANVVGYSQVELTPGFSVVRTPFVGGDSETALDIQDVFDTSTLHAGGAIGTADSIQLWNAQTSQYERYYLNDGLAKNQEHKAGKWIDNATELIASNSIAPGTSFFFSRFGATSATNTLSGNVVISETGTNSIEILEGFNLVATPFTSEWAINDGSIDWISQGAKAGSSLGTADSIQLWSKETSQYEQYYLNDGLAKNQEDKAGKWIDNATELIASNLTVGLNQGFFYSRQIGESNLTIIIDQPYNLD
jgi:hypothetical protein